MVRNSEYRGGEETEQIITIKGMLLIEIYESFDGSYWFITEKCHKQDSIINGRVYKNDQILFGYVRLSACPEFAEWGYISETELRLLGPKVWKVPRENWPFCPEVEVKRVSEKLPSNRRKSVNTPFSCPPSLYQKNFEGGNKK